VWFRRGFCPPTPSTPFRTAGIACSVTGRRRFPLRRPVRANNCSKSRSQQCRLSSVDWRRHMETRFRVRGVFQKLEVLEQLPIPFRYYSRAVSGTGGHFPVTPVSRPLVTPAVGPEGSASVIPGETSDSESYDFTNRCTNSEWYQYPPAPKKNRCKPIRWAVVNGGCEGCIEGRLPRPNHPLNPA
jgi:hypothetical protein